VLEVDLLLIATLVTSLTKQFTVLLLGHTLAALLDNRAHNGSSQTNKCVNPKYLLARKQKDKVDRTLNVP